MSVSKDFSWLHFSDLHLKPERDESFNTEVAKKSFLKRYRKKGRIFPVTTFLLPAILQTKEYIMIQVPFTVT